jgi:hypothetical protein
MSILEIDVGDLRPRSVEFTATELVVTLMVERSRRPSIGIRAFDR